MTFFSATRTVAGVLLTAIASIGVGPATEHVVVAELFTSEGCSSCPPADDILGRLADGALAPGVQVIALSEHVDYWNNLGWRDPFSARAFSDRQASYAARQFQTKNQIYTPQLIVDGRTDVVGSDRDAVVAAVTDAARAPKATMSVTAALGADGRTMHISVRADLPQELTTKRTSDLLILVTEDGLVTQVQRGENSGRQLAHTGVVRHLAPVAALVAPARSLEREATVSRDPAWNTAHLHVVALLQERGSLHIIGAAATRLH